MQNIIPQDSSIPLPAPYFSLDAYELITENTTFFLIFNARFS